MSTLAYPSACLATLILPKKRAKGIRENWDHVPIDRIQERFSEIYGSDKVSMDEDYKVIIGFGRKAVEAYPVNLQTAACQPCSREGLYKIASSATLCTNENNGCENIESFMDWQEVRQYLSIIEPYLHQHNKKVKQDIELLFSPGSELKIKYNIFSGTAGIYNEKFGSLVSEEISISKQIENEGVAEALSDLFCLNVGRPITTRREFQKLRNREGFDALCLQSNGSRYPRQNSLLLRQHRFKGTKYVGTTYPSYKWSAENTNDSLMDLILPMF